MKRPPAAALPSADDPSGGDVALVGATVYPGPTDEPLHDGVVLVRKGKIAAVGRRHAIDVPSSVRTLDGAGLAVVAGLCNSHVHFFERKWADAAAIPAGELERQLQDMSTRYGFTSVFDTGSPWENTRAIRGRVDSGEVAGPRIRSTGEAILVRGASPPEVVFRLMGSMIFPAPEIGDASEAAGATRKLLDAGVDAIKLHLQAPPSPLPPFPPAAMAAAVTEAHRAGRLVFAHPNTGADVRAALEAGVDVLAHTTPATGAWGEDVFAAIAERRVALTPTLTLFQTFLRHDRVSVREATVATAVGQLRDWIAAAGTVLFGTDLGAVDEDPRQEYALMARAGMSFRQILAALTTAPAELFGESHRLGRVAEGLRADLVVLNGDPAEDLDALADVRYTLRDGKIVSPLEPRRR